MLKLNRDRMDYVGVFVIISLTATPDSPYTFVQANLCYVHYEPGGNRRVWGNLNVATEILASN